MVGTCLFLYECSSVEAAKFSLVAPCATFLCWWILVLNNFLPFPLLMKWVLIWKKNILWWKSFSCRCRLGTNIGHRGTANIMLHILQINRSFVVYSPECILTSSEAIVGKGLFVWLIFSTRHVFPIIKHKSTHF